MFIMACMARCDFAASLLDISSRSTVGTICQDKPYLSLSHPHATSLPPPAASFFQYRSTSACVLQSTINETDSLNLNCESPLSAMNFCPAISNSTVITEPVGPGPASP